MAPRAIAFNDAMAYEGFMSPWSRAVGKEFLDWMAPPRHAHWLDVGCGSGAFTALIFETCAPASLNAVDTAAEQIAHARAQPIAQRATFHLAPAQTLPFNDRAFDIVVSALVINFIADRLRALAEMCRVCRRPGIVAGYIWDSASDRAPNWPFVRAMRKMGMRPHQAPDFMRLSRETLHASFKQAGFSDIVVGPIKVTMTFPEFESYWRTHTPAFSPHGKIIASLTSINRRRLMELVRNELHIHSDGSFAYEACATAIRSSV